MNILKEKKVMISILILTVIIIIINSLLIQKQIRIYKNSINIFVANIIGELSEKYPDMNEEEIISILNMKNSSLKYGYNFLEKYGIDTNNVFAIYGLENQEKQIININIITIIIFGVLALAIFLAYKNKKDKDIKQIINYIEQINRKNYDLNIGDNSENELSNLKNELYKITIMLKEQAENSTEDKKLLQKSLEDISHQLKTPLTSISIMLDNIRENPDMEEQTRNSFIREISRQIEWINWLIISLLKLSKLDSGTTTFTEQEINVRELINDVVKNLLIPIDIKQQNIIINGKDTTFLGDYNWQLEAITNIVKNCIEHSPEKSNIYINFDENKFYTKIIIRDEGVGIDKQDIKHIFERFYKGKNSSENSIGIGLALAKSIIEKNNGHITCFSKVNEGTIFEIKYIHH